MTTDDILTLEEMETDNWWFDEMSYYYDEEALGEVFDKDND